MTEDGNTFETVDRPRGRDGREWEVFVREAAEQPLTHVGSVTADDRDGAREQATALFDDCVALWLAPAEAVDRYTDASLRPGETA